MARLRTADTAADDSVPPELLSADHRVWRDPAGFAEWCARHGAVITRVSEPMTWAERFQAGRDAWAVCAGICPPGRRPHPVRLVELGIPHSGALDRARAESQPEVSQLARAAQDTVVLG